MASEIKLNFFSSEFLDLPTRNILRVVNISNKKKIFPLFPNAFASTQKKLTIYHRKKVFPFARYRNIINGDIAFK